MATSFLEVKNNAYSLLVADITAGATSLSVTAGEGTNFPTSTNFHITVEDEIMTVTAVSTDTFTVTRGAESTTGAAHSAGVEVSLNLTAKHASDIHTAVNTLEGYCASAAVLRSLFDAHSIIAATTDDTPVKLTVAEQTLVGRITSGNIASLTIAQIKTLLGVAAASGIASLGATSKVVQQPTSITDHLDDTEHGTDAEVTKAPTSNVMYDHDVATTGVHGVGAEHVATSHTAGTHTNNTVWKATPTSVVTDSNRTATLAFGDLDLTASTSANAKFAWVRIEVHIDSITAGVGNYCIVGFRKNGETPAEYPVAKYDGVNTAAAATLDTVLFVALDAGQVVEYTLIVVGTIQFDTSVHVLGYVE